MVKGDRKAMQESAAGLPPLLVYVFQPGFPVKTVEFADPRAAFCREVNSIGETFGVTAATQTPEQSS